MTMEWNNRDYQFDGNGESSNSSFQEHDRQMREFRTSHANIALVNGPRPDEADSLENLLFLRINYVTETGGARPFSDTDDWSVLVPLSKVPGYKLSPN